MRRHLHLTLVAAALALALAISASPDADAQASSPGVMRGVDCATVTGSAVYRSGYTHIVTVANGCSHAISCEVATSVDPSPTHHLDVPAGQSRDTVTRIGSPAYEFRATATCTAR